MPETLKILLVEDNPGDADFIRIILEGNSEPDYEVTNVQRLSQALQAVTSDHFDLIILDLGLPDSSGLETLWSLIRVVPTLPVVVLTGNLDEQVGLEAVKAGAQDFLNKGQISSQLLLRVLRYAFERKQGEMSLRNAEHQFRTILDALDVQVLLMGVDHHIIWPNRKVSDAFGLSREEIIGRLCYELLPGQEGVCEGCPVERAIATGDYQYDYRRAQIGKTWDIKACPVFDEHGRISSIVTVRTDISSKVLLEEQFFQAQKMEAIGRLAGGVAHDFNNMLSVILGFTEIAKSKAPETGEFPEYLDQILQAGIKSADLVRQLLAFSRKQTVEPQIVDCNTLLESSRKMLKRLVGEDIDVRFMPAPDLWMVMLDPSQLDQVIVNLTVNARDAIRGVGVLTITTANVVLDQEYCRTHVYATPGEYVLLEVSDTGCGMSKEVLSKIFEPFFTTKKHGQGTGLGMATIFGIVKQNNGIINVYSELNHGTTVRVYFPRLRGKLAGFSEEKELTSVTGNETVLVVEDDQAILELCRSILSESGYTAITETDPLKAIEVVAQRSTGIDLLLTDVIMPNMNGKELQQAIEKIHPALKTLFMSGYTSDIITHQGILAEGVHFLQKPFSKEQLARKVRAVLDQQLLDSSRTCHEKILK
jgi:two-component system, cell cycle sensor histidine kinase and response regulator CckA